ncbi:unnamed protein product [Paramecium sonneborni]|uniref:NACHT domain-containing protein n=1 Tax=Paramecium sonneborni TaxID=65129 RepID=A0A8S1RNF5_9CILI|nr:unnamed protein product [Paramecium sonneborni]
MIFCFLKKIIGFECFSNLNFKENYVDINREFLKYKCIPKLRYDKDEYLIKQILIPSLRGGGCCGGKSGGSKSVIEMQSTLGMDYRKTMQSNCQLIIDKCDQVYDNFSRNEIMMSLQWFIDNRYKICEICKNDYWILMLYDLALKQLRQLVEVISIYLRESGCLCYYVLEVCNDLLLIIYTYQLNDEKRFLLTEVQIELLSKIEIFYKDLEAHQIFWKSGLEFQVTLMKTVLINSRTNSKKQQDKLIQIASAAFSSLLSLSIKQDFINNLCDFAKYLLEEKYNQFQFPIKTYQIYYFFFLLKWSIIKSIQDKNVVSQSIVDLQSGYEQHIQNSDNWIVHFCWINAISDLISYRKIISLNEMKQSQLWNELIKQNIIQVLSYDKLLGKVNNSFSFNSIDCELGQKINDLGFKNMRQFQNAILNQQFINKQNFFQFYVDFTFSKLKKTKDKNNIQQQQQQLQLLGVDEQQKKLEYLCKLLKEIKGKVEKYNESLVELFPTQTQEVETKNKVNYQEEVQQLEFVLFKLSYLLQEVDFTMIIEMKRIEICQEQAKLSVFQIQNEKDKKKSESQIGDIKQLENIYNDWIKLDVQKKKYNQIFDQISKCRGFQFKFSKNEKNESQKQQQQTQDNQLSLFIRDIQILIENFLKELNIQYQVLWKFWSSNNKLEIIKEDEKFDEKMNQFFLDIIEKNKISFINNEEHKEFKETLIQQQFQNFEDIQYFGLNIQNYIKMMIILKGQYLQQIYIFSKLKFNIKQTLEIKQSKELKQQDTNQQQQISINELISEQQKNIETFIQKDLKKQNCIQEILEQIEILKDKIIVKFASQQNSLVNQALILQNELINLVYQFRLSSDENLDQFKKDIQEKYQQYNQNNNSNNDQFQAIQDQTQPENIEQNEYLILISKKLTEWNQYIINIDKFINNMEELSHYVNQYCKGLIYLTEKNIKNHSIDEVKKIIKELINKLELEKQQNQLTQNILDKKQTEENQLKNKNFSLKDFATIFCFNQTTQVITVQIDKEYQEILDYLEQERNVERKFYDLSKDYIVRECFLFHLIKIQFQVPEKELLLLCQKYIKQMWMVEKDESVRAFLKNKEMIEIQKQLFSHDLKTLSASIKDEMNQRLQKMDEIEQKIRFEGYQQQRDELQRKLIKKYEKFEQFLDNISEMSQQLDITLIFLKELQKNVKQIKKKIDELQESINEIINDVRKLRGKKYEEIFKIRKEKVKKQAYLIELDSVYIPLKTQEFNPFTGLIQEIATDQSISFLLVEKIKQNQKNGMEGEVNQFIYEEETKDVMLIKGQAGSGKSRAAKKIEEYLWEQYQDEKDWIPIYISLPQQKNPKFNLLDQALESENYGFDKVQLKDFKEEICNNKIYVVIILDSYDEMKQDSIQSNLIETNNLIQNLNIKNNQKKNVKFIITTRKEILTSLGYQTWFYGEDLKTFKEVEIMNFDDQQSEEYLKHYVKLSIKRRIKSQYDFVKQIKKQDVDVQEFLDIWNNILVQVDNQNINDKNSTQLLTDQQIENISQILKKQSAFQYVQDNQLIILKKELKDLWSANFFNNTIKNLNIQNLLKTPFMLEIVVQILPSLSKKYKGSNEMKEMFKNNLLQLKRKENLSKKLLQKYKQQAQQKDQVIIEEYKIQQKQIEQDQEDQQQDNKSLKQILDKLESQRFFENFSITDISLVQDQLKYINDDELKVVIAAFQMKVFTIYEFYQNFIEFYHEQQIQKLRQLGKVDNVDSFTKDLVQFSESLAIEMTINSTTLVNYEQKGRLKLTSHYFDQNDEDQWKMQYFDDLEDEYRKLVRSSVLINLKGKSYSFNHKSLQEFYVAQHINNLIDKLEIIDNKLSDKSLLYIKKSVFNKDQFNIFKENYLGSLSILKQKIKLKEENTNKLKYIAKLSKNKKFKIASSNSFCLLSYLQVYLGEQDYSGIHLEKTTLKGLSFYKSKFQNSNFKEVIIDSCLFDEANLENAKWENIICSEKPSLEGHQDSVVVIQYSNDDKLIASADSLNVVKLWDVVTFEKVGEIRDVSGKPKFLVFSADNQLLFVGEERIGFRFLGHSSITDIVESWLIIDPENIIKLRNIINKQEQIIQMQLSSNQNQLLIVDNFGLIQFWDIEKIKKNEQKNEFVLKSSESEINFIQFFQNGEMLASASQDNKVILWNVIEQKVLSIIEISFQITYLAITSELLYCVSAKSENFSVWNIKNIKQPQFVAFKSKNTIYSIIFTPDDQYQIENLGNAISIQKISNIWNEQKYYRITNQTCIDFSSDENLIATSYLDEISLWQLQTKTKINTFKNNYCVTELQFIADGKKLLAGNQKYGFTLWCVEKCQLINDFEIPYKKKLTISSDFDKLAIQAIGGYSEVVIISLNQYNTKKFYQTLIYEAKIISLSWDDQLFVTKLKSRQYVKKVEDQEQIEFENGQNDFCQCVFSHQSSLFASYNEDSKTQIWTYKGVKFNEKHENKFDFKISFMVFSFNDKYLAMTSKQDKLIKIWDFSQNQIYTLQESINEGEGWYDDSIDTEICFSCDSQYVAFYNNDEIKIWKFITDQTVTIIKADNSKIRIIASSPKQNYFATSSNDELNIKFWNFETKQLLHQIKTGKWTGCLCFTYDGKYLISARTFLKLWDISNFPKIKLCSATESNYSENVQRICCLHQKQGIWFCNQKNSGILQFDEFKYLGILASSNEMTIICQFSLDNQFIVGGISDKVCIWNSDNNYQIDFSFKISANSYKYHNTIESVTYCQDQIRLVVTISSGIYILNIKSRNLLEVIPNLNSACYAKMFFNDQYLYSKEFKCVKIWKNDGDNRFTLIDYYNLETMAKIDFSKSGKYLVKKSDNNKKKQIIIYSLDYFSEQQFILFNDIKSIKISNNSQYLIFGNHELSRLVEFKSNVFIKEFTNLGCFEFCPDDQNIIFCRNQNNITLYNIEQNMTTNLCSNVDYSKNEQFYEDSHLYDDSIISIQFSNFGKILVINDGIVIILLNMIDFNQPQFVGEIVKTQTSVQPITSSQYLASIVDKNSIQFTDMIERNFVKSIKINKAISCDLKNLVFFQNETKVAYLQKLSKHIDFVVEDLINQKKEYSCSNKIHYDTIAISKDRKNIVFSSSNQLFFYENEQHQEFNQLDENISFFNFSFSQDSKYLAGCGSNKIIYFWDFKARKVMDKFQGHSEHVNMALIFQNNTTLASCSDDKLIRFWNLNVNFNRISQDGHQNSICNIEFSADGLILYSGSEDQTLKLWDMQNKVLLISKTFNYKKFYFSISQNQERLIITNEEKVELWNISQNLEIQKSQFEINFGGYFHYTIKSKFQKMQLLSNDNQFITLSLIDFWDYDVEKSQFSLAEIWEKKDKIDESIISYEYINADIEIDLIKVSQDFKYICSVDYQNNLTLGELSQASKSNLTKLKNYNQLKIINLLFSNNSKILSSVDSQNVVFRDLDGDYLLCSLRIKIEPEYFFQNFTDDDKFYYTNFKHQIYLWNVNYLIKDEKLKISESELDIDNLQVQYFTISNNLKYFAIGLNDYENNNMLRVVDLNSMATLKNSIQSSKINLLLFSDDDLLLAVANELNEILVYEIAQFEKKYFFQCHQAQIIKMQFFFYKEAYQIEYCDKSQQIENSEQSQQIDNSDEQPDQIDNQDDQLDQIKNNEQKNTQLDQSENSEENKNDITEKLILSLISFDKNYSIAINFLDDSDLQNQTFQFQDKFEQKIQQVIFSHNVSLFGVITHDYDNNQFQCFIQAWSEDEQNYVRYKKINNCKIAEFCFDDNFIVYCNQRAELHLIYLDSISQYEKIEEKQIYHNYASESFEFLKISQQKSIVFTGNNKQIYCWKLCREEDKAKFILLRIIENKDFIYTTMFLRQENHIYYLINNKIQKIDFTDTVEKLKSCLIYKCGQNVGDHCYHYKIKNLKIPLFRIQNCHFSSDLSLCVCVGEGDCFKTLKNRPLYYKYLILWDVKTLKQKTLSPCTKFTHSEHDEILVRLSDVATFFPKKKILISNRDECIVFMDCQDIDSITDIAIVKENEHFDKDLIIQEKYRVKHLIVSKDEKLLISICPIGILKLWNIYQINQITQIRVIYSKFLNRYSFTQDIFCYCLQKSKGEKFILKQINLTKYPVIKTFVSFSLFYTFSIMQLQTIIAFGGQQLVLWNYMTNKNKVIWKQKKDKQSTEITSVIFGNNSNLLAAARDSIIILIEIKNAEPIKFSVIKKLKGHQDKIICLSILHDNSMIISGSRDKTIRFWSIKSLTNVQILQIFFENISEIKLSPNCIDMAVAMENGSIRLYKLMFPENIHDEKLDEINLKGEYIHCYKIFGRESLIFAHNCSLNENTEISQDGKSLERLFLQKKAKKFDV